MIGRHLQIVVCGAGPAVDVAELISLAYRRAWTVAVAATEAALGFIDAAWIEELTGHPVRVTYQATRPAKRVLPTVDALMVAPATFNTVNKLAAGIADSYALTLIAELIGCGVPTVVVPFVNSALAGRSAFVRSLAALREEGVRVVLGPEDGWEPHPPGTGNDRLAAFRGRQRSTSLSAWRGDAAPLRHRWFTGKPFQIGSARSWLFAKEIAPTVAKECHDPH